MMNENMFQGWNAAGLFPINYWALQNTTTLLETKNKKDGERLIMAQIPQHPNQYGFGIPVVNIYRDQKGDVFEVRSIGKKMIPLKPIEIHEETMGS